MGDRVRAASSSVGRFAPLRGRSRASRAPHTDRSGSLATVVDAAPPRAALWLSGSPDLVPGAPQADGADVLTAPAPAADGGDAATAVAAAPLLLPLSAAAAAAAADCAAAHDDDAAADCDGAAAAPRHWYRIGDVDVQLVTRTPGAAAVDDAVRLVRERVEAGVDHCFYVVDMAVVRRQVALWRELLPRVEPFYAVKCNPNPVIMTQLAKLGVNFDCASQGEIDQVLSLGVDASRIIYANACKPATHLTAARERGVELMTFDSYDELLKIKRLYPEASVVLRMAPDDSMALCKLSVKYGASLNECYELCHACRDLGLQLVGVSFHVGSGCYDLDAFPKALRMARAIFDEASACGFQLSLLDIGGGFPGLDVAGYPAFAEHAARIAPLLDELFDGVRVMAEPGRFMVAASHTLAVRVFARRIVYPGLKVRAGAAAAVRPDEVRLYVDDGVYGSFSCIPFDHQSPCPLPLVMTEPAVAERETVNAVVFGPTCDGLDTIHKSIALPLLAEDDWLVYPNMGAYTTASSTKFNGFFNSHFHYVDSL